MRHRPADGAFLDMGGQGSLRDDVRGRPDLMGRRELERAAEQALAQEA